MQPDPARVRETGARSHFLAAIAVPGGRRDRVLRQGLRCGAALGLAAAGGWLVMAVRARQFDPDGPGRFLYWLHDHVALPAWGHAWTAIHPYGVIWLAVLLLVIGIGMAGWLLGLAPVRVLQRRLTLALIRRPRWRAWLVGWHRRAMRIGLRPLLFEEVLRHDRRLAMDVLAGLRDGGQAAGARTAAARRLAAATLVQAGLDDPAGADAEDICPEAVELLAEAAVTLAIEGAPVGDSLPDAVARDLTSLRDALAARVVAALDRDEVDPGLHALPHDDFDWRRPAAEILVLLSDMEMPDGPNRLPILRQVGDAVDRRLTVVETLRHSLERDSATPLIRTGLASDRVPAADPAARRLAVLAALLLADRAAVPHLGIDSVEAFDALALTAALRSDGERDNRTRPLIAAAGALSTGAVDTDIYRLAARLAAREDPAFRALFAEAGDVLGPGDPALLRADIEALTLAAGRDAGLETPDGPGGRS
ncbi:MAG: hypothetical protein GVY13_08725 [Alphaproteobacteria bacterium]|jgi:hypothetical protein|nr:hypothetical protein [Alphaproteobacteria bacterium]